MKNYYLYILFLLAISFNTSLFAQDSEEDAVEVSTVEQLLMLVKEGKTKKQSEISDMCPQDASCVQISKNKMFIFLRIWCRQHPKSLPNRNLKF